MAYCIKCQDKLEERTSMTDLRSYDEGGLFGSSGWKWDNNKYFYCDNNECPNWLVLMAAGLKERTKKRKPAPTDAPELSSRDNIKGGK